MEDKDIKIQEKKKQKSLEAFYQKLFALVLIAAFCGALAFHAFKNASRPTIKPSAPSQSVVSPFKDMGETAALLKNQALTGGKDLGGTALGYASKIASDTSHMVKSAVLNAALQPLIILLKKLPVDDQQQIKKVLLSR